MSVAKSTNLYSANHPTPVQGINQKKRVSDGPANVPKMLEARSSDELTLSLFTLPDDIKPLILKHSNQAVFNLRQTCKSWNLHINKFLAETPEGESIMREKREGLFRDAHGTSVLNFFRVFYKNAQSLKKICFSDSDDDFNLRTALKESKTSNDALVFTPAGCNKSITSSVRSILQTRSQKLTIIEIDWPRLCNMASVLEALKLIPRNGFVALVINSELLALDNARSLWEAISLHPGVMHIECNGNGSSGLGNQAVEWITLLARQKANVTSFALNFCRVDELDPEALSKLLSATTGILELEVNEGEITAKTVVDLANAVGTRNATGDTKLTFYFSAANHATTIGWPERKVLASNGICFRVPGQPWVVQKDPADEDSDVIICSSSDDES